MHQRIRDTRNKESGFTLIELLIVIVILGILAAVVIFASGGFKDKGISEACKTNLSSIKTSVEAFRVDDGAALFPSTFSGATGVEPKYFDFNGVSAPPTAVAGQYKVTGKGWTFLMNFDVTGPADNPPTYAAGAIADGKTCV